MKYLRDKSYERLYKTGKMVTWGWVGGRDHQGVEENFWG